MYVIYAGKDRPTIHQLHKIKRNEAAGISNKWKELGTELLDGYEYQLDAIQHDSQSQDERCNAMFQEWLNVKPDANWNKLIEGLRNINMINAASNVKAMTTMETGSYLAMYAYTHTHTHTHNYILHETCNTHFYRLKIIHMY